jgi:hypothetical protein
MTFDDLRRACGAYDKPKIVDNNASAVEVRRSAAAGYINCCETLGILPEKAAQMLLGGEDTHDKI